MTNPLTFIIGIVLALEAALLPQAVSLRVSTSTSFTLGTRQPPTDVLNKNSRPLFGGEPTYAGTSNAPITSGDILSTATSSRMGTTYRNNFYGFQVTIPSDWTVEEDDPAATAGWIFLNSPTRQRLVGAAAKKCALSGHPGTCEDSLILPFDVIFANDSMTDVTVPRRSSTTTIGDIMWHRFEESDLFGGRLLIHYSAHLGTRDYSLVGGDDSVLRPIVSSFKLINR